MRERLFSNDNILINVLLTLSFCGGYFAGRQIDIWDLILINILVLFSFFIFDFIWLSLFNLLKKLFKKC